jgi:DNA-binding transcriptional regulator YhcF (GntR family)
VKEKSIFVEFFGDYPIIRVLDFLITFREFDYNKKDISRNARVAWNTLKTFWKELEKNKIIVKTRKVGKSIMYKLNEKNPIVKELIELNKVLMLQSMEEIEEKTTIKAKK